MELYAAMVENMDFHVGRVVDYLEQSDQLDDTVTSFTLIPARAARDTMAGDRPPNSRVKSPSEAGRGARTRSCRVLAIDRRGATRPKRLASCMDRSRCSKAVQVKRVEGHVVAADVVPDVVPTSIR